MAFSVVLTVQDNKGKQSTIEVNLNPAITTTAQLIAAARSIAILIEPLIKGSIVKVGVGIAVTLNALAWSDDNAASVDSDVEEGARFQFLTDNGFYTGFRLPTFDEQYIVPGTDVVDTVAAPVAALITALTDQMSVVPGGGTGTVTFVDKRDITLSALSSARESFQSSRSRA